MDQLISEFPKTLLGWLTLITLVIVAASFIFYTWRNQSIKLLRDSIIDMNTRINFLEAEVKRLCDEKGTLEANYKELKFKKNYLKQILIEAVAKRKDIIKELSEEVENHLEVTTSIDKTTARK